MQGKIFEYIEKNFEKPLTLIFGILLILFAILPLDSLFDDLITKVTIRYLSYLPLFLFWIIYWLTKKNLLPKNPQNLVGLVICIETENDKQRNRIKNDFVHRIHEIIEKHNLNNIINLIYLNENQSEYVSITLEGYKKFRAKKLNNTKISELTDKDYLRFKKIQKRINGHFYVWGSIKERKDEESKFFFNLEGLVLHDPLDKNTQISLKKEFQNIWARSIEFQEKVEFKGFLLSADLIFIAVEYIAGLAALYSGNAFIAINLHKNVEKSIDNIINPPPNISKVSKTLKSLIPQEFYIVACVYNQLNNISETEKYISLIFEREPNNYSALLLRSVIEFTHYRNPKKSLETTSLVKKYSKNNGTWRYNQGFLLMYLERFEEALKVYKKIAESSFINEIVVINEVIQFNLNMVKNNPDFIQSYFILGYLFYKKLINIPEAYLHFEKYKKKAKSSKYVFLNKRVKSYFTELEQLMELK